MFENKFLSIIKKHLQFYLSINNYFKPNYLYPKIGGFCIKRGATSLVPFDCSINELALRLKKIPQFYIYEHLQFEHLQFVLLINF